MWVLILLLVLVLMVVGYFISTYNYFQTTKTRITASIQEIGNQLKRQASLIPNLSESAKAYLTHESGIYEKITQARKAIETAQAKGGAAVDKAVDSLNALLPQLTVIVESNPELKANTVVMKLMDELRDTSDKLMYARRTLIDLTADYNTKLITFPSNLVAKIFGFQKQAGLDTPLEGAHLSVSTAETEDVKVDL
jgi:LemA protein